MALTREQARAVLDTYIQAWETQDPDLIVTIFTASATYHERVLQDPIPDRDAIRRYWQEKVVRSQANIKCELLNLYLDGTTVIAEWQAEFDDLAQNVRKRMREIAVLTFEGTLVSSLREYWSSERIGPVSAIPSALSAATVHFRHSTHSRKRGKFRLSRKFRALLRISVAIATPFLRDARILRNNGCRGSPLSVAAAKVGA